MADNKKYYYLKLKENFFDEDSMVILESMPDGYIYSNILLKLYLRSLKNNGLLLYNNAIPYNTQVIATVTRHSVGNVEKAIQIFRDLGLIEILDNGAIYMSNIQLFVGQSSTEAERKQKARKQIDSISEFVKEHGKMPSESDLIALNNSSGQMSDKYPPEIEIEKELELKKDIEIESEVDIEQSADSSHQKSMFNVFDYYQQRIGALDGFQYEQLKDYIDADGLEVELLKIAIDKSADNGKRTFGYVNAILNSWAKSGIKTVAQQQEEHRNWVDAKSNKQQPIKQEDDGMDQYRNRTYTAEEIAEVERDLEEMFGKI